MLVNTYKDYDELSKETGEAIIRFIKNKPDALLCLAAGDTPAGTFSYLVKAHQEGRVDFSSCRFVGLDEWVGLNETNKGSCSYFMYKSLFEPLGINPEKIVFFDACSEDLKAECIRIDNYISLNGRIDLMLVGVGMNGHIALNEPGVSFELYSHVVELDSVTKSVAQKYFDREIMLEKGITLGLKHLTEAQTAIVIASGRKKSSVMKKAIKEDVTSQIPASIIQTHKNGFVFLDEDAAAELKV